MTLQIASPADRIARDRPGPSQPSQRFLAEQQGIASTERRTLTATILWATSAWLGLASGLVESGVRLLWWQVEHRVTGPDLWVSWHAAWLGPLASTGLFLLIGLILAPLRRWFPASMAWGLPRLLLVLGCLSAIWVIPGLHRLAALMLALGVASQLGRMIRLGSPQWPRVMRRSSLGLAAVWGFLLVATGLVPASRLQWHQSFAPTGSKPEPNVILIVLDTVRAKSMSTYGYERPTTPNFTRLAEKGIRFNEARATSPFTLGTHASLFTGQYMSRTSVGVDRPLDGQHPTLAEHFRNRGYLTAGFVGNIFYGSARYGLDRGFLHYHDTPGNFTRTLSLRQAIRSWQLGAILLTKAELALGVFQPSEQTQLDAEQINREALRWVDQHRAAGRPYFLFFNYFDAHSPYRLPVEAPRGYAERTPDALAEAMHRLSDSDDRPLSDPDRAQLFEDVQVHLRNAYDDGITYVDDKLGELLSALDDRGLLDHALVIVTSDHGEMLGEHGRIGHGVSLDREVIHVPLVLWAGPSLRIGQAWPEGRLVEPAVSLRDIPATILDLTGQTETAGFPGRSLAGHWNWSQRSDRCSPAYSEVEAMPWEPRSDRKPVAYGPIWQLTEGGFSYLQQEHDTLGTVEHLYHLDVDPGEQNDLSDDPDFQATLQRLRHACDQLKRTGPKVRSAKPGPCSHIIHKLTGRSPWSLGR